MLPLQDMCGETPSRGTSTTKPSSPSQEVTREPCFTRIRFLCAYGPAMDTWSSLKTNKSKRCCLSECAVDLTLNSLVDFTGEFTAALYGHSHPVIQRTVRHVLANVGMNVGATTAQEQLFAKEICRRFEIDQVRFTNSGTEANLQALAAARHFTKKRKIVVFDGGYHGSFLSFAGGKPAANNVDFDDWIVATFNDVDGTTRAIRSEGVAAVLVEGMQGAGGCICATPKFLTSLQETASEVNWNRLVCY